MRRRWGKSATGFICWTQFVFSLFFSLPQQAVCFLQRSVVELFDDHGKQVEHVMLP